MCSWVSVWQVFDDFIFIFFAMEMVLKMVALGIFGKKCYLGDTWNRLDFFIVMAGQVNSLWVYLFCVCQSLAWNRNDVTEGKVSTLVLFQYICRTGIRHARVSSRWKKQETRQLSSPADVQPSITHNFRGGCSFVPAEELAQKLFHFVFKMSEWKRCNLCQNQASFSVSSSNVSKVEMSLLLLWAFCLCIALALPTVLLGQADI